MSEKSPPASRPSSAYYSTMRPVLIVLHCAILLYLLAVILWHFLTHTMPFAFFSEKAHLEKVPEYLRNAGVVLMAASLLLDRKLLKAPKAFVLYGICLCALIASFFRQKYGIQANLDSIAWMMIVFTLFYSAANRMKSGKLRVFLTAAFIVCLAVWFVCCCLSLYQFVHLIGTDPEKTVTTLWLKGKGFYKHRLYGVFGFPEYGAVTGLMLILGSGYFIVSVKSRILKVILVILDLPLFWYIVLCRSRNAVIALYECVFVGSFLAVRSLSRGSALKRNVLALLLAFVTLLASRVVILGTLAVAEKVPGLFSGSGGAVSLMDEEKASPACVLEPFSNLLAEKESSSARILKPVPGLTENKAETTVKAEKDSKTEKKGKTDSSGNTGKTSKAKKTEETEQEEDNTRLLQREETDDDITTGRSRIWKDYLSLYRDIGLFGLSPENASWYIQEHHPDLYIAAYIKRNYKTNYANGYVFHTHNGYLKVYVSAGLAGFLLLLLFMVQYIVKVFQHVRSHLRVSPAFVCSLLVVITGASAAMFDLELFFVYHPSTFLFWLALGLMLRSIQKEEQAARQRAKQRRQAAA